MAMQMSTGGLLAAALGLTAILSLAADRPAEAPAKQPMACPAKETPAGSFIAGGQVVNAGRTGSIVLNQQDFETIDTVCPCFFGVLQQWWQTLTVHQPSKAEADGLTCPYLKQASAADRPNGDGLVEKDVSFLDNLAKLDKARKFYEQAEYYRRTGHPEAARYYYQLVIDQGPGSRYARMARQQMDNELSESASEAISAAPEGPEVRGAPLPAPVFPERADSIIMESLMQPSLPALDPELVKTLEKILADSGDPEMPKLILQDDSPDDGAEAQELDPALGWVPGSPEEEASILDVFEEEPNRSPDAEEAEDEAKDEVIPEFIPDWNQVMREVIEAVGSGACVEIDNSRLGHLRFLCQKQVGALTVRIYSDSDGVWRCVVASLDPEESTDLRAAQRAFNDGISRWIEAVSAGSGDESWDEDDDWPDDDGDLDDEGIGSTL